MAVELLPEVGCEIAEAVSSAGGAEVFFAASVDHKGMITGVEVLARGDEEEVPAVLGSLDLWEMVIHNHPGGDIRPSKADIHIAAEIAQSGKGFAIVDNTAQNIYVVVEPMLPEPRVLIDPEELKNFFSKDGPLAKNISNFESRKGQLEMSLSVLDAFNNEKILAVEAGTGSGKSFAYLVPCVMYAMANKVRVIVTTGTINLQEQLISKDLPVLQNAFHTHWEGRKDVSPFIFSLIKGRGNYLCLRRTRELAVQPERLSFFSETNQEESALKRIIEWSRTTKDGSLSDLPFYPGRSVWEGVSSDGDNCLGMQCPEFKRCFYFHARFQAAHSTILVVNHHLFFADLAIRKESGNFTKYFVLPAWRHVVFDEAHNLEAAASSFFGINFTQRGVLYRLGRLQSVRDPEKGTLPGLYRRLMREGESSIAAEIQGNLLPAVAMAREEVLNMFDFVRDRVTAILQEKNGRESSLRYTGEQDPWNRLFEACSDLAGEINKLKREARAVLTPLSRRVESCEKLRSPLAELNSVYRRLEDLERDLNFFANQNETDHVRWIELRKYRGKEHVGLKTAPFLVGKDLEEALWRTVPTCILTSATLSVDEKIDFLANRLGLAGLPGKRFQYLHVSSPFDWQRQSLFLVPSDVSDVNSPNFQKELGRWIVSAVQVLSGGCFILFTSYSMLERVYNSTKGEIEALGIQTLRQGEEPRGKLLERFKTNGHSVLFGTESFWQGVDVRGDALSCVLIVRLPFAVPSEPLQVARMEEVRARGKNPFRDFSLPQAVLKLRQGVGRLIRSRNDRGVIIVFDSRILFKSYGRIFLKSLPPFDKVFDSKENLILRLEEFFKN